MQPDDIMSADRAASDLLILVDQNDNKVGEASKWDAHINGLLHRAFSVVFVRDGSSSKEILLTQRALGKYHSGGLWTNTCCSHPRAGEELDEAVPRRLAEELGVLGVPCTEIGSFYYRADFDNGITEHEYDHVFLGEYDGPVAPDPEEISDWRWVTADELMRDVEAHPEQYSVWCPKVFALVMERL